METLQLYGRMCFLAALFVAFSQLVVCQEKKITQEELPAAVRAAFEKAYPHAQIKGLAREMEKGNTYYEIESVDGKIHRDILFTPVGDIYEIEEAIDAATLPQMVKNALQKSFGKHTVTKAEKTSHGAKLEFSVELKAGKKSFEVSVDPAGKILESKEIKARQGKEGKDEEDEDD